MIPAIVLAGGASSRMGQPKALLRADGQTFVRRALETLRAGGIAEVVVVIRPGATDVQREIHAAQFGRAAENPQPDRGQLSSLLTGLDALDRPGVSGILVTLVDVPLIQPSTIVRLLSCAGASSSPILRAVHDGRHGHPVIFMRPVFEALRHADLTEGAKTVMRAYPVEDVEVADAGVLRDIDTPADFAALG